MCGFLGMTAADELPLGLPESTHRIAVETTAHRGPDGTGLYHDGHLALSCFRLALNGGEAGNQPVVDGGGVVAYNGETYRLGGRPVDGRRDSDTRLVVDHLAHDGAPADLDGMFALARWRPDARELALHRDRFGIKPLYWGHGPSGGIAFGSRALGVRTLCGRTGIPAETAVAYLSLRGPVGDQEPFGGVRPLPPGATLTWTPGDGAALAPWWRPVDSGGRSPATIDALDEALSQAVDLVIRATADVGFCLSGGVDSSLLVAMARRLVGPDVPVYVLSSATNQNDVEAALAVAETLGVRPRVVDIVETWPDILDHLLPLLDEPPITESTLGVAALAAAARADGVKALVSGEGADEVFGGYDEYRKPFQADDLLPEQEWLNRYLRPEHSGAVPSFVARVDDLVRHHRSGGGGPGTFDFESRLSRLLRRLDTAMMAYGIEGRVPYLVAEVAELGMSWSWEARTAGLGKTPLRDVAARWLPEWVSHRPKRPFASGVRRHEAAVRRMLARGAPRLASLVVPECVEECRRRPGDPQSWKVAALGAFLDEHDLSVDPFPDRPDKAAVPA